MKSTDLEEFIHKFKLIFLTEIKLHSLNDLNISIYRLILKNRKGAKRCSGGVAILVHESIDKYVKCPGNDIKESLWITFSGLDKGSNIIFGLVYNPPADFPYADSSTMDLIENTIVELTSQNEDAKLCGLGDFNARTGQLSDNIRSDDSRTFVEFHDIYETEKKYFNGAVRVNSDKQVNNMGRRLIEMCRSLNLIIMNGRFGKDKQIGKKTCKDSSTVDYIIISTNFAEYVSDFDVLDFDPILSDIHCPVYAAFTIKTINKQNAINDKDHFLINKPKTKFI